MKELRCICGSLVAKIKKNGIELKCRRCKRVAMIPFAGGGEIDIEKESAVRVPVTFDPPCVDR